MSAVFHGPIAIVFLLILLVPGWRPPDYALLFYLTGLSVHAVTTLVTLRSFTLFRLLALATAPLYWPLQTAAAIKALVELWRAPFFWDKTEHGLSPNVQRRVRLRQLAMQARREA